MRNHFSLSERVGTTSQRRAEKHHISLWVARGFPRAHERTGYSSLYRQSSFCPPPESKSACASKRGLGDYAHLRVIVLARASMTYDAKLIVNFSHESDVTSLDPFLFYYCVPHKIRRGILLQTKCRYFASPRLSSLCSRSLRHRV